MKGRDKMIHSFLLIGQSNMAGRGYINEVEPINNPRIKVLRNGRWQDMFVPVNPDRPFSGINLAESFCDEYSKEHDIDVGIIPCADGGTALSQWAEGSLLFDNAVYQCTLAQRTSAVAGILWHQGEGDCSDELYPLYFDKFTKLITAMRVRLGLENTPLLIGGLGDFLAQYPLSENLRNYGKVNSALQKSAQSLRNAAFVSAEGLTSNPDMLHFNAASLREFGVRYYSEFQKLEKTSGIVLSAPKETDDVRSQMEQL